MATRLELEILEDRLCPATHIWQGPATGGVWSNAANWNGGVPTTGESGRSVVEFDGGIDSTDDISGLVIFELHFAAGGNTIRGASGVTLDIAGEGYSGVGNTLNVSLQSDAGTNAIDASLPVNISGDFAYLVIAAGQVTIASPISGHAFELGDGSTYGTLALTASAANTFTDATQIDTGTLLLDDTGGVAVPSGLVFLGAGRDGHARLSWLQPNQLSPDVQLQVFNHSGVDFNGFAQAIGLLDAGANNFTFGQSSYADAAGVHTSYTFTLDDVVIQTNPGVSITTVIVSSRGGTATINTADSYVGTDGLSHATPELVGIGALGYISLLDAQGNLANPGGPNLLYWMVFSGFSFQYATLGPEDAGVIATRGTQDTFISTGSYAYLTGPSSFDYMQGGKWIVAYGGAGDVAYLYDGSGPSTYTASGNTYSVMTGTDQGASFVNEAIGFGKTSGIAQHPGQDTATFYDSAQNDVFAGFTYYSYLYAVNPGGTFAYFDIAYYFSQVTFYSFVGGQDVALVYDATVNHVWGTHLTVIYATQ